MDADAESAFGDEDIHIGLWDFCFHDVSIFFAAIVTSIENLDAIDLDNEHGCAYDVPCNVRSYLDALLFGLYSELHRADALQTVQNLLSIEQRPILLHFSSVSDQIMIDIFGGLGHVDLLAIGIVGKEIGESPAMIEMCMRDEDHGEFFWVDMAEKR